MPGDTQSVAASQARLSHIDGLRGIAILAVVMFHAYARWPGIVPFGDRYVSFPPFLYGWLGVELFFLISGFVILMTLERCEGLGGFLYRRWLRLWPAMLVCSLLVFFTAPLFAERPSGAPGWATLLPGLTFVQPDIWSHLIGDVAPLEGAFWTIFIEVKFYLIFGALFFLLGTRRAVLAIVAIHLASTLVGMAGQPEAGPLHLLARLNEMLGGQFFGWFAAGALFFIHGRDRDPRTLALAVGMSVLAAATIPHAGTDGKLVALLVVALFTAGVTLPSAKHLLGARALVFVGFISYPLYLMHENMMIAIIAKLGAALPWLPGWLLPPLALAPIVAASWCVAALVEPRARSLLRHLSSPRATLPHPA